METLPPSYDTENTLSFKLGDGSIITLAELRNKKTSTVEGICITTYDDEMVSRIFMSNNQFGLFLSLSMIQLMDEVEDRLKFDAMMSGLWESLKGMHGSRPTEEGDPTFLPHNQ